MMGDFIGLAIVVMSTAMCLPQLVRLARTRDTAGVSLASMGAHIVSAVAWTIYGVMIADMWVPFQHSAALLVEIPLLVLLLRYGTKIRGLAIPGLWALLLAVVIIGSHWFGLGAFAAVIGCSTFVSSAPAVWTAVRSRSVSGLSPGSWAIIGGNGVLYGLYFAYTGVPAGAVYAAVNLAAASTVLGVIAVRTRAAHVDARPLLARSRRAPSVAATFDWR